MFLMLFFFRLSIYNLLSLLLFILACLFVRFQVISRSDKSETTKSKIKIGYLLGIYYITKLVLFLRGNKVLN